MRNSYLTEREELSLSPSNNSKLVYIFLQDLALERKWESEQTQASDDADVVVKVTEKNNRKLKINHGDCKTSLTFANNKMAAESIGKLVTEKDMKVDVGLGGEIKQAKGEWKITAKLNALASDLGGAKAGLNVSKRTYKVLNQELFCALAQRNKNAQLLNENLTQILIH